MAHRPNILCLASFFKGNEFIRESARLGARVLLLTRDKLADRDWPRESLDKILTISGRPTPARYLEAAVRVARMRRVDRIVALEELDVMSAAFLREELGVPGMSLSTARLFQDKLAMRVRARDEGIAVPEFVHTLNVEAIAEFLDRVPPPWMLKPRVGASAMGMRRMTAADDVWRALSELEERRKPDEQPDRYLLEAFVAGDVFHVDTLTVQGEPLFESVEQYGLPPFEVVSRGGISRSHTVRRGSSEEVALLTLNRQVLSRFGFESGVTHVEFIRSSANGRFLFLEGAARVGGAYTAETIEAATGVNLWAEWARLESSSAENPYVAPCGLTNYGGVALSLARQEHPDTIAYTDPEIVMRVHLPQHVGLVVSSPDYDRVATLVDDYVRRFTVDFTTSAPLEDSPARYI